VGSDCHNMQTFVGQIITVSDGAGWIVTVSKWRVAKSSRHPRKRDTRQLRMYSSPRGYEFKNTSAQGFQVYQNLDKDLSFVCVCRNRCVLVNLNSLVSSSFSPSAEFIYTYKYIYLTHKRLSQTEGRGYSPHWCLQYYNINSIIFFFR
jgi:hypothetical protein